MNIFLQKPIFEIFLVLYRRRISMALWHSMPRFNISCQLRGKQVPEP